MVLFVKELPRKYTVRQILDLEDPGESTTNQYQTINRSSFKHQSSVPRAREKAAQRDIFVLVHCRLLEVAQVLIERYLKRVWQGAKASLREVGNEAMLRRTELTF